MRLSLVLPLVLALVSCTGTDQSQTPAAYSREALLAPDVSKLGAAAPDSFTVAFFTSRGEFDVLVRRAWAPHGADRLHYLVLNGFFNRVRFYRVMSGFIAQFGLSGDPEIDAAFASRTIPDDPVRTPNRKGTLVFATEGPNTRTTQLFVNLADNAMLDAQGFAPVGDILQGMDVLEHIFPGYGEGPRSDSIKSTGNSYLRARYPQLDSIVSAAIVK
jgi:peptidyl-prolyl cis-trans isomerase A (cyclophilin A)